MLMPPESVREVSRGADDVFAGCRGRQLPLDGYRWDDDFAAVPDLSGGVLTIPVAERAEPPLCLPRR
ncbi:MAG: hypothetical protein ABSE77_04445 [Acidimicrobiales bacterium]